MTCWIASNHSVDVRLRLSRVQFPVRTKVSPCDVIKERSGDEALGVSRAWYEIIF